MISEEIMKEIFRGLKEPYGDSGHWSKEEILRRMNIGQLETVRLTDCIPTSYTAPTEVGVQEYSRPNTCMRLDRIWYKTKGQRLYPLDTTDLDLWAIEGRISKPWTDNSGEPANYYVRGSFIGLYPKPDIVETFGVEGIRRPDILELASISAQIPFNGKMLMYDFHNILVSYVLWKCLLEDKDEYYKEHKDEFFRIIATIKMQLIANAPDKMETFDLIRTAKNGALTPIPFNQ